MTDFQHIVRNRSSRNGVRPRILVLHTTEGANRPGISDLQGLANLFDNAAYQASSHLGIDAEGNAVRMVPDSAKAWTQMNFNSVALSIEQVGFSATSTHDWINGYHHGLRRVALALARWSREHDIPLKHSTWRGVCQHKDLGGAGGGHHDCGPGYPETYVILWARLFYYRHKGWNKRPRWRRLRAESYKRRVLRQQRKYGVKHPSTT